MWHGVYIYLGIIFSVISACLFVLISLKDVHIIQLELYSHKKLFSNYYNNKKNVLVTLFNSTLILLLSLLILLLLFYETLFNLLTVLFFVIYLTMQLAYYFITLEKNIIIKLKLTPKVKRFLFTYGFINFLILCGICLFAFSGCLKLLIFILPFVFMFQIYILAFSAFINSPLEKFVNAHYIKRAKQKLKLMKELKIIGITGSFGKTSVKFILTSMLQKKYETLCTPHSYNTPMGITKTINNLLMPFHEVLVVEMGADHVNDIQKICKIVRPEISIITSVGSQHLNTFKTFENIVKTKYQIIEALDENGIAVFNTHNEICNNYYNKCTCKKYAVNLNGNNKETYVFADNIKITKDGLSFNAIINNTSLPLQTKLLGEHNIVNILLAAIVAKVLGVNDLDIVSCVKNLKAVEHRLELKLGEKNEIILDDSFNSNIVGANSALNTLKFFKQIKVVITPGIVELGEEAYVKNYELGKSMANVADFVYIVKQTNKQAILDGLMIENFEKEKIKVVNSFKEAKEDLYKFVNENYVVLIENDLPDNYE